MVTIKHSRSGNILSYCIIINVPIGKTIVAIALVGVLIFSGFLLRSFGKGEGEEVFRNEKHPK